MIKRIGHNTEVEVSIIPKLKECNSITLCPGDTLLVHVDHEQWDMNTAQEFYKLFSQAFPNNNVMVTFKGIDIGVIKEQ